MGIELRDSRAICEAATLEGALAVHGNDRLPRSFIVSLVREMLSLRRQAGITVGANTISIAHSDRKMAS